MKRSILFARSNIRKARGQAAAIFILVLLAAMLLNIWLMLFFDYKQNFNRCHDRLNAEHVTVLFNSDEDALKEALEKIMDHDQQVTDYSIDYALLLNGVVDYNGGKLSTNFFVLDKEQALARRIGKYEIIEDGSKKDGIYLPMLFGTGDNYQAGEQIEIETGSRQVNYQVSGFYNSAMTGSHNCGMCALLLGKEAYKRLEKEDFVIRALMLSVRIQEKDASEDFEAGIINKVSAQFPQAAALSNSYEVVSSSRYISQMISAGIISAMAFFITLIALVVIASNTVNYIQENMKDLGALKAIGYTGRQLIGALLLQFLSLTLAAAGLGAAGSYILFPSINQMMVSQIGIPYEIRFLPVPFLLTLAVNGGTAVLAVWLSSRKIKRVGPITALRQGMETHNFKRNHIPLADAKLPLHTALALKTTLSGVKQNITVSVTMLVLSLVLVFSSVMVRNVITDMQPMLDLIVGEMADTVVGISVESEKEFRDAAARDERIERVYLFNDIEVRHVGHIALNAIVVDDCKKLNNQKLCVEGRFPKYDNEMLVGARYAKEQGIQVGDEIHVTAEGKEAAFLICGFTQMSNYLGKDCMMLRSGYERMGKLSDVCYYMNLADGVDVNDFNEEMNKQYKDYISVIVNIREVIEATSAVYVQVIKVIVAAIILLSIVIIVFVLFLLVRTLLTNKKHDYGILKALGFTTRQLILQTAMSFMPAVIVSAVVGIIASMAVINPLIAVFLSGIGMIKCTFEIPVGLILAAGAAVIGTAFGFACLLSLKIRKFAPKELLSGE